MMPWYRSDLALIASSLVFPPLGLLLLWTRARPGLLLKLVASGLIAIVGIVHLFKIYGMRVELDGSGRPRFFTFQSKDDKARDVEQSRASAAPPTAAPEVAHAAAPPPVQQQPPPAPAFPNYWTDYRGPNRRGIYDEMPILTKWPKAGLKRLWKQPVGEGYASFTVANGLAFTIEQRRDQEVVAAYDLNTGREKWTNKWQGRFQESMGGDGPRTTPVYDSGRIYALGAEGEFRCLDAATGAPIWRKNVLRENGADNNTWAQAATPLIVDGKAIVVAGGTGGKSVIAYDKTTGEKIWGALDDIGAYAAPVLGTVAGKRQLLVMTGKRAVGLTVEEGRLLWETPWETTYNVNATFPIVVGPNRVFISSGYGHGAAVVELTPAGDKFDVKTIWQNTRMKTKFNDPVLFAGHVYGLDEGILSCVNVETGAQTWKGGRYGFGQVLLASGHLVIITERGELVLVKADPKAHTELASFQAIEGKTWNNAAISNGILLVRNTSEMAAFRIGAR